MWSLTQTKVIDGSQQPNLDKNMSVKYEPGKPSIATQPNTSENKQSETEFSS